MEPRSSRHTALYKPTYFTGNSVQGDSLRVALPAGAIVKVNTAAELSQAMPYDAIVLESAVYMGRWLPDAIFEYIEGFHNRRRRRSALGWRSPLEFETVHTRQLTSPHR